MKFFSHSIFPKYEFYRQYLKLQPLFFPTPLYSHVVLIKISSSDTDTKIKLILYQALTVMKIKGIIVVD